MFEDLELRYDPHYQELCNLNLGETVTDNYPLMQNISGIEGINFAISYSESSF